MIKQVNAIGKAVFSKIPVMHKDPRRTKSSPLNQLITNNHLCNLRCTDVP